MESMSIIQSFYNKKSIFITGGTGFMGKVLIEKLLRSCNSLERIYILLRPKRGQSVDDRLNDIFKLPLFDHIKKVNPNAFNKLVSLTGDVTKENLGLDHEQVQVLHNEVHIVFHCAATLKLESNLKDAISMNTIGTRNVLSIARNMKNLQCFIHLSTAFCHVDQKELTESICCISDNPHDVAKLVQWLDCESLNSITTKIIQPHPNTYTYSKRLAEKLIADEFPKLPCAVARPSIVTPAWSEPLPGWVDNLNGPVGLIVGAGKGVIRSMHCNPDFHAEVIPVDLAINALIAIAYKTGTTSRSDEIPVYNITQNGVIPITWGEVLQKGKSVAYDYPFEGAIWYPDGDIRGSKFIHNLFVFFFHIIPAYFIDFIMFLCRQKRFMVRIQKRISDGLDVLQYFTTREWNFHNTNLLNLWRSMSEQDRLIFSIDFFNVEEMEYIKNIILGARQYCMKEKLNTLPRARRHQNLLYIIHVASVYIFYFTVIYAVLTNSKTVRDALNCIMYAAKSLCNKFYEFP
ncbi:putative fatty acyl-CoA reductase CG5065 [Phymastichus coffea]|uniref:putative fatty acyl-CoA reductase CG5065 n=1 Tax=Phymastichus coffea TaxID=108790 RepID=UPI00273A8BA7|nr:putative fatty acyl-CoA reductase CG5065 [Phymastichus coffea]